VGGGGAGGGRAGAATAEGECTWVNLEHCLLV
jgi:hypothetical protein